MIKERIGNWRFREEIDNRYFWDHRSDVQNSLFTVTVEPHNDSFAVFLDSKFRERMIDKNIKNLDDAIRVAQEWMKNNQSIDNLINYGKS